jgi:NADH-quinone oxidoreductase subunit E
MTTSTPPRSTLRAEERDFLDNLFRRYKGRPGMLLLILEEAQERHPNRYLPPEVLEYISARTGIPGSQVYSVATFYALFNLKPQGEHSISICRGTACHTRGSRTLLERTKLQLGLKKEEEEGSADKLTVTTPDLRFTLRTLACFGQCALAPVVEVDHQILSHVNERALEREIKSLQGGKHEAH